MFTLIVKNTTDRFEQRLCFVFLSNFITSRIRIRSCHNHLRKQNTNSVVSVVYKDAPFLRTQGILCNLR